MKAKISLPVVLIIIAGIISVFVFIKPILIKPELEEVAESELFYLGQEKTESEEEGERWYVIMREEVKAWVGILCQATPAVLAIAAFALKGRKKN